MNGIERELNDQRTPCWKRQKATFLHLELLQYPQMEKEVMWLREEVTQTRLKIPTWEAGSYYKNQAVMQVVLTVARLLATAEWAKQNLTWIHPPGTSGKTIPVFRLLSLCEMLHSPVVGWSSCPSLLWQGSAFSAMISLFTVSSFPGRISPRELGFSPWIETEWGRGPFDIQIHLFSNWYAQSK